MAELSRHTEITTFSVSQRTVTHTDIKNGVFKVRQSNWTIIAHTERGTLLEEKGDVLDDLSACFSLGAELQSQSECGCVVKNLTFNDCFCECSESCVDDRGSGT